MFKKVLKIFWWFFKLYLNSTILFWAFIGVAEAFFNLPKSTSLLKSEKLCNKVILKQAVELDKKLYHRALCKYKYGWHYLVR